MTIDYEPLSRRDRLRITTIAEIKRLAWAQVAEGGALAVSLRAIARAMGMTSSGLYRYFAGYEQLLAALVADGFASLADTLEAAEAALPEAASAQVRWMQISRAHRRWALEHATEYALIFGTPFAAEAKAGAATADQVATDKAETDDDQDQTRSERGDDAGADEPSPEHARVGEEHKRGVAVLFRVMIAGMMGGELDPTRLPALPPELGNQLQAWRDELGLPLTPSALAGCLFAWAGLHGAVSLELFGQLPPLLVPADALFDQHMRAVLLTLGCTGDRDLPPESQ